MQVWAKGSIFSVLFVITSHLKDCACNYVMSLPFYEFIPLKVPLELLAHNLVGRPMKIRQVQTPFSSLHNNISAQNRLHAPLKSVEER